MKATIKRNSLLTIFSQDSCAFRLSPTFGQLTKNFTKRKGKLKGTQLGERIECAFWNRKVIKYCRVLIRFGREFVMSAPNRKKSSFDSHSVLCGCTQEHSSHNNFAYLLASSVHISAHNPNARLWIWHSQMEKTKLHSIEMVPLKWFH